MYPILARNKRHTQGKDIVFLKDTRCQYSPKMWRKIGRREFLVKYVPKTREFRVHVLGGKWVSISEKIRDNAVPALTDRQKYVWCKNNGYMHVPLRENDELRPKIGSLGVKAAKALNFDFGAVDIILGEDRNLYVLEVNSAPCLNDRRLEMYAQFIKESYENSLEVNKREA
jgi:D-alanine-D-alanine ligase-like ATP-grasp enzyme